MGITTVSNQLQSIITINYNNYHQLQWILQWSVINYNQLQWILQWSTTNYNDNLQHLITTLHSITMAYYNGQ